MNPTSVSESPTALDTSAPSLLAHHEPAASWPDWFQAEQREAWEAFQQMPAPTRRDETWRFADTRKLDLDPYLVAGTALDSAELVARSKPVHQNAIRVVFANNELIYADFDALPEGAVIKPLEQAASENEEVFRKYFMKQQAALGSAKYALLHKASLTTGLLIHLAPDTELERPVEVFYWVEGENVSIFPHTLVVCERFSKAKVVDHYYSADGLPAFACGMNDLHAGEGASLKYTAVQEFSSRTLAFQLNSSVVGRNAHALAASAQLGGARIRNEFLSQLTDTGARSDMISVVPATGERVIDQRTLQDHLAPDTSSDLLYHNALADDSRTIFSGLIRVEKDATRSDAYQHVKNLMLSNDAEAQSLPGLQIENEDVRCSHGATGGPIDEEEVFYLRSRGIPQREALGLLTLGFFETVLKRLGDPEMQAYLTRKLRNAITA